MSMRAMFANSAVARCARLAAEHAHRREVLDRIVGQICTETRRDRVRARCGNADRVAVRWRLGERVRANIAAGAGTVLDHDLLAEFLAELLPYDARNDVGAGAGREGHDQTDRTLRPRRIAGLRSRDCAHKQRRCQCDRNEPRHPAHSAPRTMPHRRGARSYFAPMTACGNHVAISGNMHSKTTASIISPTNGITPHTTSRKGISGAMFLITKMFSPTGGWMRPISMMMVMITPNHTRSKPAALSGGRMIGAVIRMIETGGRKKPSTTTISRIAASSTQRESSNETIHCAVDWLICK